MNVRRAVSPSRSPFHEFHVESGITINHDFSPPWASRIRRRRFRHPRRIDVPILMDPDANRKRGSALGPDAWWKHIISIRIGGRVAMRLRATLFAIDRGTFDTDSATWRFRCHLEHVAGERRIRQDGD